MLAAETHWNRERYIKEWYGTVYRGYPIIFRDDKIQGGVYKSYLDVAITVDPSRDAQTYASLEVATVGEVFKRGRISRQNIISSIFDVVSHTMVYSEEVTKAVDQKKRADDTTDLSDYLREKAGVCRHQALACAWLMERFIESGDLDGRISVDANEILMADKHICGHAWARYAESTDAASVTILDVAHNYLGPLVSDETTWNYSRPEEWDSPGNDLPLELLKQ